MKNYLTPLSISAVIVIFYLTPLIAMVLMGKGSGAGIWGLFEIVALFATIIAPVVYGWMTRDTNGAVLIGVLPFLLIMTVPRILSGELLPDNEWLVRTVVYIALLCAIGGFEGYFASRHEVRSLVVAIVLAGAWSFVFISDIN